ncbi:hypothetical protein CEXT_10321 [Caerostris extrusa]|uniref:Uncharacterized protein n=1 Tax=Caerostris extrusa TaxID=172846 RepID=A0AAV4RQJ8_CAEEX|nr:hypothetical protein CEXT_10321 [Caerostris extrusa]
MKCSFELEPESIQRTGNSKFILGFTFARLRVSAHIKLLCNATRAIGGVIRRECLVRATFDLTASEQREMTIACLQSALFEKKAVALKPPCPYNLPPTCTLADSCSPIKCSSEFEPESIRFNFARLCPY